MFVGTAYIIVLLARRPSEPFVSVNVVGTNAFGSEVHAITIAVTNRMSFNVDYWIGALTLHSNWSATLTEGGPSAGPLNAHTQTTVFLRLSSTILSSVVITPLFTN